MVELDLFTALAKGPLPDEELARRLALTPDVLDILMNAGASLGLVERRARGWGLGLKGAAILGQGGIQEMVAHHGRFYADLADPVALLRGGRATELRRFWTYAGEREGPADDASGYTALMAASQAFIASGVLHDRAFRSAQHLFDLGGGAGAFAIAALKCHPKLTATVADRADVVPQAAEALAASGLTGRSHVVAHDFFVDPIPEPTDLVTLVRILHDHDDDAVAKILGRIAGTMSNAQLAVIEPMADRKNPSGLDAYFPWYFKAMGQGRYRTREALTTHLSHAGLAVVRPIRSRNPTLVQGLLCRRDR